MSNEIFSLKLIIWEKEDSNREELTDDELCTIYNAADIIIETSLIPQLKHELPHCDRISIDRRINAG